MIKIKIDVPVYKLDFENAPAVIDKVGSKLADKIKQRTRQGVDAEGNTIPEPKDGGTPLNRTGQLLDSISWKKSKKLPKGSVQASTKKRKGEKVSNAKVAAILNFQDRRDGVQRDPIKILDANEKDRREAVEIGEKELKPIVKDTGRVKTIKAD